MTKRKAYIIIVICFIVSVALRVPTLQRPVSIWRDYNTAFFLIPMELWDQTGGPAKHNFMHSATYGNPGDQGITNLGELNNNGNCYYHSFPTFSLVFPYVTFKILHITPSAISIRVFNLFLGLITVFLVFEILFVSLPEKDASQKLMACLAGALIYLFSTGSLFYHGNGYTHHVMVIPLILATAYSFIKYLNESRMNSFILFLLFLFLSMITEWIGYFMAFSSAAVILFSSNNKKLLLLVLIGITGVLAVFCFIYPPAQLLGVDNFVNITLHKFEQRSFGNDSPPVTLLGTVINIAQHFKAMYLATVVFIIALIAILFFKKAKLNLSKPERVLMFLFLLSAWMHHIVFINFTLPHDYSTLIDLSYLSLFTGFMVYRIIPLLDKRLIIFSGAAFIALSTLLYYHYNRVGTVSLDNEPYNFAQKIAAKIKTEVSPDDVILIKSFIPSTSFCPPLSYHLKRNYYTFKTEDEADELVRTKKLSKFVKVYVSNYEVSKIVKSN